MMSSKAQATIATNRNQECTPNEIVSTSVTREIRNNSHDGIDGHEAKHFDSARHLRDLYRANSPIISSSEDSESEEIVQKGPYADAKMRVGRDYQAAAPAYLGSAGRSCHSPDHAVCVWTPLTEDCGTSDLQVAEFVDLARDRYGYSGDQAMGMLYWHRHNIELATADLPNFMPHAEEWTHEEKVIFEQAVSFQGKNFHKISYALPHKTVQHLVKHYYLWKKTRTKISVIDKPGARDNPDACVSHLGSCCRRARPPRRRKQQQQQQQQQPRVRRLPRGLFADADAFLTLSRQSFDENSAILAGFDAQLASLRTRLQRNRGSLSGRWRAALAIESTVVGLDVGDAAAANLADSRTKSTAANDIQVQPGGDNSPASGSLRRTV